jgi:diaminohydroxyphosphoribosylaminopyrimidine deaminase / 5-amino-6-(5-phosphoribosylamino)uracil reductase
MSEPSGYGARRPHVTLKLATSLDGKIATRSGASKWITGAPARDRVHQMRARFDCVLTGIGTVLGDDPELTARTNPPPDRQPLRAVLDSKARTPDNAKLYTTVSKGPVCFFHDHDYVGGDRLCAHYRLGWDDLGLKLDELWTILAQQHQIATIMVEAGGTLAGAILRAGFVDQIVWFRAPLVIGGDGKSVFEGLGVDGLDDAFPFTCIDIERIGQDLMETYVSQKKGE